MTLQELTCFMEVAKQKSFSRAADRLFISQPTVSKHIAMLEDELGFALLDRTIRRSVELTPAGKNLFECLQRCSNDFNSTLQEIRRENAEVPVRFILPEDCSPSEELSKAFDRLYRNAPELSASVSFVRYDCIMDELKAESFLICCEDSMSASKQYLSKRIPGPPVPYYLIASAQHEKLPSDRAPVPEDFTGSPLFLPRSLPVQQKNLCIHIVQQIYHCAPVVMLLDSVESIMVYLKSRRGITIATGWFKYLTSPDLLCLPLGQQTHYSLYWKSTVKLQPKMQEFIDRL